MSEADLYVTPEVEQRILAESGLTVIPAPTGPLDHDLVVSEKEVPSVARELLDTATAGEPPAVPADLTAAPAVPADLTAAPADLTVVTVADEIVAASALLRSARRVVVAAHVNPDGDALGSALAVVLGLRSLGIDAVASFGTTDGYGVPATLSFLPGQEFLRAPADVIAAGADVLVTVDTGSADRLGPLEPLLGTVTSSLVVDHHTTNTRFGTHLLLDTLAASTTVVVARLLDQLGVPLTVEIATCLYVGLVTDTGQFQFSATTPEVHELAARLLRAGVRPEPIGRSLFGTSTFAAVKLQGLALSRAMLEPMVVWTWISAEDRLAAGVPLSAVEGFIDALRASSEAEIAIVLKGAGTDTWIASTRSKGRVDMGEICSSLGGGGHRFAAGVTLHGDMYSVMGVLREAIARHL